MRQNGEEHFFMVAAGLKYKQIHEACHPYRDIEETSKDHEVLAACMRTRVETMQATLTSTTRWQDSCTSWNDAIRTA